MGKRLLNVKDLMMYVSLSSTSARKFGHDIGAAVRIGGRVLYDKNVVDAYIDSLSAKKEEE